ncbi:uncharacterized protein C5orf34 homolog isoform X2 [Anabas testudineus]|uniref:uncharacterized protein C5orf34 homolog isoform X2 n=1 Tax=Anabas testudineus TaxID=64144 RepID=UPI000E462DD3|nr:uncharacterized protein C5orf34 homolog isoform X2 [Anabas testudineus]
MMETSVSLMIMYEDESVDVRYVNGSQLQLSPCGCEFVLVKAKDPSGHALQPAERVRQRTRFTISMYKELMVAALAFRNKYASRPYLPQELIPAEHKKPFFSIDSDVLWPEWSSCEAEFEPGGETIIRSQEGQAVLVLSPSGEEFSTEFTCSLSQTQSQHHSMQCFSRGPAETDSQQKVSSPSCQTAGDDTEEAHRGGRSRRNETPEEMYQSTTVVQHHSCSAVAHMWSYPLSLARHLWTSCLSKSKDVRTDGANDSVQADRKTNMSSISSEERRSRLPQALPLTCPSPHWHRWKTKDPLAKIELSDQGLQTEPVKVLWCQGVTYRILSGAIPVIEVSPGDGSVIRSNNVLSNYFTHHKPNHQSGQVQEVTYHLNSLPPDIPGQPYSICSIVTRASRILTCYNQAKQSLNLPATPSCLQEVQGKHFSKAVLPDKFQSNPAPLDQYMTATQTTEWQSDLVAAELEKIKRFTFLLENSHLLRNEKGCAQQQDSPAKETTHEPVDESCVSEALQRTSRVIQDIDAFISQGLLKD